MGNSRIDRTGRCNVTGRSAVHSTGYWLRVKWYQIGTMNGNTLNDISDLNLICDSKMCGWFAGQFSRDNRRNIYIPWTDLLVFILPFVCESCDFDCCLSPASASAERHSNNYRIVE